jgi:hypothetical protein
LRHPNSVISLQEIDDLLNSQYSCIVFPLTLPFYNSLRIAEYCHRLQSPTVLVLCSLTDADEQALLTLFDAFVKTNEVTFDRIQEAVSAEPKRLRDVQVIERAILRILETASVFRKTTLMAAHSCFSEQYDAQPDMKDYRDTLVERMNEDVDRAFQEKASTMMGLHESVEPIAANYGELRKNLIVYFNKDELRTLCFDLGIEYENLPDSLDGMTRELVRLCERRGLIPKLVGTVQELRPAVLWRA